MKKITTEYCTITIKDSVMSMPTRNIPLLAMTRAMDLGVQGSSAILTQEGAIEFLEQLGFKVEEKPDLVKE